MDGCGDRVSIPDNENCWNEQVIMLSASHHGSHRATSKERKVISQKQRPEAASFSLNEFEIRISSMGFA